MREPAYTVSDRRASTRHKSNICTMGNQMPYPCVCLEGEGTGRTRMIAHGSHFSLDAVEPGKLLSLAGRLDVHAAADARLALADAVEHGAGDLVIDLTSLESLDATGLGVLVGAHRCAGRAGRLLVLRDVPPPVGRLLFLFKLDRVLRVETTDAA